MSDSSLRLSPSSSFDSYKYKNATKARDKHNIIPHYLRPCITKDKGRVLGRENTKIVTTIIILIQLPSAMNIMGSLAS